MSAQATLSKRCVYLLTQSRADARKLYKEKIDFVVKNMEQLQETIHRKQDNLRVVDELLQVVRRCILTKETAPAREISGHILIT